jgi:xanthine/uracil permease
MNSLEFFNMRLVFSSIQWFIFILAGSVVAPLAIGAAFGLSLEEIAGFVQRTFFVIGLVAIIQSVFGHRMPIVEGPAALWWSVFLVFIGLNGTNDRAHHILQSIELGLMISGLLFILLSVFNIIQHVKKLFTPIVTGTYFILLVAQISGPFIKGIIGVDYKGPGIDWRVSVTAIITAVITILFSKSRYKWISSYSVLLGMLIGWGLFALFQLTAPKEFQLNKWFQIPEMLAWGMPKADAGVILTSVIVTLLLLVNIVSSIDVVEKVTRPLSKPVYNRSGIIMGISQILSGVFSTIGFVPLSYTAGFIMTTKMMERLPFIIGSLLILLISFFPFVTVFFASIPTPVGYASMLLAFSNMMGIGIREYSQTDLNEKNLFIIGISLMIGIGSMFIPTEAVANFPTIIASIVNNGLIVGVLICMVLEQLMSRKPERFTMEKQIDQNY